LSSSGLFKKQHNTVAFLALHSIVDSFKEKKPTVINRWIRSYLTSYQKFDKMLDTSTVNPGSLKRNTNDKDKTNDDNLNNEDEDGDNVHFFN
jgi:hypothetical protein